MLRAAVLGGGSWGTTVASIVAHNTPTQLWARNADVVNSINDHNENNVYLPGLKLNSNLTATNDLAAQTHALQNGIQHGSADIVKVRIDSSRKMRLQRGMVIVC